MASSSIDHAESCGPFQMCHIFSILLIRCINVWSLYLMVFGNYEPPWRCIRNDNKTLSNGRTYLSDVIHDVNTTLYNASQLDVDTLTSIDRDSSMKVTSSWNSSNETVLPGSCNILTYCDKVVFDPESVTLVTEFQLICDQAFIPSVMIAVQRLGMLIGSYAGGQLGEMYGRKLSIYGSLAVTSLATLITGWSTSWQIYTGLSFFIGLGGGGITALNVYAIEYLTPTWRGRFGAIPLWNIALLIFAFIIIGLKVWWQIHILCGVAGAFFLFSAIWTPESLRWLRVHGKEEEAEKVIQKIVKWNSLKRNEASELSSNLNTSEKHEEGPTIEYTYLDLFRIKELRVLTIKNAIIWFSVTLCYFTLGFSVKAFSGDYYTNLLISCVSEIPFILTTGPCLNFLGRRITGGLFMSLSTLLIIACVIVHFALTPEDGDTVIKYLAFAAKGCSMVGWSAMTIFSSELFPTVVRSLGIGLVSSVTHIAGIFVSTLIPRDQQSLVICFCVLSAFLLIASAIVISLPETKNRPLRDMIKEQSEENDSKVVSEIKRRDSE